MGRGSPTAMDKSLGSMDAATGKQELYFPFRLAAASPNSCVSRLVTGLDSAACRIENTH